MNPFPPMKGELKLALLMLIGICTMKVVETGSDKMVKGYVWFGPNAGPTVVRQADQARESLLGIAAASALAILVRPGEKKEARKATTPPPPRPPIQYGGKQ